MSQIILTINQEQKKRIGDLEKELASSNQKNIELKNQNNELRAELKMFKPPSSDGQSNRTRRRIADTLLTIFMNINSVLSFAFTRIKAVVLTNRPVDNIELHWDAFMLGNELSPHRALFVKDLILLSDERYEKMVC